MPSGDYSVTFPDGMTQPFSGTAPADAAEKAARQLEPRESREAAKRDATTLYVWPSEFEMEHSEKQIELLTREEVPEAELPYTPVHAFEAWAWNGEAPEDAPEWQPETITKSDVEEVGVMGDGSRGT